MTGRPSPSREIHLLLAAVIGVALVGYFVGLGSGGAPRTGPPARRLAPAAKPAAAAVGAVHGAVTYAELRAVDLGPNRNFRSTLADLASPVFDPAATVEIDAAARPASLRARAARRAYNGAPPVVPHPIDQIAPTGCLTCHGPGLRIGDRAAPRMPHPPMASCTQCHVERAAAENALAAPNGFRGAPAPSAGHRASPGAPPVVPHATFMRTDCLACHGPAGLPGLRTSHPGRQSCLQCHAPSAALDQQPGDGSRPALPPSTVQSP